VTEEYMTAISMNIATLATTPSQDSGSRMTTTLRQIAQNEHSLADIEQQLVSGQNVNHQVISGKVFSFLGNPDVECLDLTNVFPQGYNFG
ncbi:6355_t:CDS:2, partial [Entrophospora sp. SA101]